MKKWIGYTLLFGLLSTGAGVAQSRTQLSPTMAGSEGHLDVAVLYNAAYAQTAGNHGFWRQGGAVELEGRFWRGLGTVADVAGLHDGNVNGSGVSLDMVTATFGPRYTWQPRRNQRVGIFGQALAGEAFGFNSLFPASGGASTSQNALALKLGGGMNVALGQHLALRAFNAGWLRTQLPNSTNNVQSNLSLSSGLVFHLP